MTHPDRKEDSWLDILKELAGVIGAIAICLLGAVMLIWLLYGLSLVGK